MSNNTYLEPWKKLSDDIVFETPWFKIHKQKMITPRGTPADYYIHEGKDSALCVCVTEDGKFIIEQQYRPPIERVAFDYPAGGIDPTDKDAEAAVRREVEEETGYTVGSLKKLATIDKDPGFSKNKVHIFLAKDLKADGDKHFDATEDLKYTFVSRDEIKALIKAGELNCAYCVAATYFAFDELGEA